VVQAALKELPYSEDTLPQTLEDAAEGFMTSPRPLLPGDFDPGSFTRRIPVWEERAKGWRTRIVDHKTESMINPATVPVDKISHDAIEVLITMLLLFMYCGVEPLQWKRDISNAF